MSVSIASLSCLHSMINKYHNVSTEFRFLFFLTHFILKSGKPARLLCKYALCSSSHVTGLTNRSIRPVKLQASRHVNRTDLPQILEGRKEQARRCVLMADMVGHILKMWQKILGRDAGLFYRPYRWYRESWN